MFCSVKKRDRTWKNKRQKHTQNNKLWDNTHPLSPYPHPDMNQPSPTYPIPPLFLITMDTELLIQMRQSNKFWSVRNDEIFNLHLGSGAGPWVSIPCLLEDTSHIYWFHPPKQLARKKQRTQEWNSTPNKSYHTALVYINRTQGYER